MSELMLDVSQAEELKMAFRREDYTNELIKRLCEKNGVLGGIKNVLLGYSQIIPIENIIDCDIAPWLPNENWKVEEHQKGGLFKWNPEEQAKPQYLYLSNKQINGEVISGNNLRKELARKLVLNANVLDWLLKEENQRFIPEEWKKNKNGNVIYIYFWGTIFRSPDGLLNVRCLGWGSGRWDWYWNGLGNDWDGFSPAVLHTSFSVRS